MGSSFLLYEAYENIVRKYFLAEGYEFIEANPKKASYDFVVRSPKGDPVVVEVKVFRTRIISRDDIIRAINSLESSRRMISANEGLLFISSRIAIPISDTGNTKVVDINDFTKMLGPHPQLLSNLTGLLRELTPMSATPEDLLSYRVFGDAYYPSLAVDTAAELKGSALCAAIRSVPPGRKGARDFEEKSLDALKYIFSTHFSNWSKQKVTDSGVSRYDVIARVSSDHDFWKSLVSYFRTWYVVFEFKNYTKRITQYEIYTTEKYLYAGAMRTVAVVISRKGADKNALTATRGAARESGKLILHLVVDDICKMLEMKDNGDDPNSIIYDRVDEMLMKLER